MERDADGQVLEVVLAGAADDERAPAFAARERQWDALPSRQVRGRERARVLGEFRLRAREDDGAAPLARAGPHLDDVVRRLDERAVVLDDDDGIARVRQLAAELGQPLGVAGVEPDRGLVEHVQRADELGAELVREVDPLRLAARQRAGLTTEREIADPDALQEGQLGAQQLERLAADRFLPGREGNGAEKEVEVLDRLAVPVGDGGAAYRDGQRLGPEPRPGAARARGLAAVPGEEDAHVELVAVGLDLLEKSLDAGEIAAALVDPVAVLLRE